jgi:hypothetical protein
LIKEYVEWVYALLYYYPEEHIKFARYTSPSNPYEAEYLPTNTRVPVHTVVTCGHDPHLVACRAKNVTLTDADMRLPVLNWTMPDRLVYDPQTLDVVKTIPGTKCKAPILLPLLKFQPCYHGEAQVP